VELVEIGGTKRMVGFNNLTDGSTSAKQNVATAIDRMHTRGFRSTPETTLEAGEQQAVSEHMGGK